MATQNPIEWTNRNWNPIVGSSMTNPGCARCYAERMSMRLAGMARRSPATDRKAHYLPVINDRARERQLGTGR